MDEAMAWELHECYENRWVKKLWGNGLSSGYM